MNTLERTLDISKFGYTILQIETKGSCNMACQFCPYPLREDNQSVLNESDIFHLIDQINPNDKSFEYVCFSQFNEPLLDLRIFDFIKYANSKNVKNLLITNALLLNKKEKREQLIDAEPTILKISLQNIDYDKFNWARGTKINVQDYFTIIYKFLSEIKNKDTLVNVDIACNFLTPFSKIVSKVLGISNGDPSVPDYLPSIEKDLKNFINGLSKYDSYFSIEDIKIRNFLSHVSTQYIEEHGLELAPNIFLKVKPFMYGRRISNFYPLKHKFSCSNRILGILADGNVVPCCLAYDPDITLGNIKDASLEEILKKNYQWLYDLRDNSTNKHDVCKKCFGEPTKRGVFSRATIDYIRNFTRNI